MKNIISKGIANSFVCCGVVSLVLDFVIEILSRHSILDTTRFIWNHPFTFLCNVLIIMLTMLVAMFFRRKMFVMILVGAVWLALGITNSVVLSNRITPFSAVDFRMLSDAMDILDKYFAEWSIVMAIVIAIIVVALLVFFWIRLPKTKEKIPYVKVAVSFVVWAGVTILVTDFGVQAQVISSDTENIADFYETNGFVYCFSSTIIDTGISKPNNYSEEQIDEYVEESQSGETETDELPNIIMVQLESFFDVNYLTDVSFSENPVSNFESLKENYTSGFLTVPVVGAGTANTEFEVLTGMNLDYFGTGEYPYKTILRESTCESLAYNLESLGYATHAVHDNKASFYGRKTVFSNLGFDTFTSIEYMAGVEYNPIDWAEDSILPSEIFKALDSTEEQDFVYTITVQSHGQYPTTEVEDPEITLDGLEGDEKNQYEYYVNQVYEVDQFIGDLIDELESYDEDTIVVFYGDHLPNIGMEQEDIDQGNLFQTEYVIWDNMGLDKEDKDLESYQLSAYVQELLGLHVGTLTNYHQNCSDNEDYQTGLEMLEYDMLYGEQYVYDETNPFEASELQMGVDDITIDDVEYKDGNLYITGSNFTEFSTIYINEDKLDTTFIDTSTLEVDGVEWDSTNDTLTVSQVYGDTVVGSVIYGE